MQKSIRFSTLLQFFGVAFLLILGLSVQAQEKSIAREWNELILEAIRNDFARPTIHARNLFHTSVAMYDSWALFDETADTYLIGRTKRDFSSSFDLADIELLRAERDIEKTISYANYRIVLHRYANAPGFAEIKHEIDAFMQSKGYDVSYADFDYKNGNAAALGNFIGLEIIRYGLKDGANEQNAYAIQNYIPVNEPLDPSTGRDIENIDPNRWQPLFFNNFIDQAGNPLPESVPLFLSPEWGNVEGFALEENDVVLYERDSLVFRVFVNPGSPPLLGSERDEEYKWGFSLVSKWAAQLDPTDGVMIDISPASIGNISEFPTTFEEYQDFYKEDGGDAGIGHSQNPVTGQAYPPQIVPRGDYARVLAEFWADGPDSETPPGHWFSIYNYVTDQPLFSPKYNGTQELSPLEYDLKSYFMLGGALHDAAIAAWSVKGYHDYIRPISAIRYMAAKGQSSDTTLPSYHPEGILLEEGLIELIGENDSDFQDEELIGKIKLRTWLGSDNIDDPTTDFAGVGWILANNWWPYQRPSFITPPFAGYVSGHSTYSRAAAEVLTYLTGDAFFPGGLGSFDAGKDDFLVFENGPSMNVDLQWATYRDASDQCSLSRIWGGIHPPADDVPGREMGIIVADKSIREANTYFTGETEEDFSAPKNNVLLYPNPIAGGQNLQIEIDGIFEELFILNTLQEVVYTQKTNGFYLSIPVQDLVPGVYFIILNNNGYKISKSFIILP